MVRKNNQGVTLPMLIITIIVLVLIAYITMQGSTSIITKAEYADFLEEVKTIEDKSKVMQFGLSKERFGSNTYEGLDYEKVTVIDPPWNFESFDEDKATGYVVNLDTLGLNYINRGRHALAEDGTVTFGKDDLFIIDKNGKVFYLEAEDSDDGIYFNADTKKPKDPKGPIIDNLNYNLINDNTEAEITLNVLARQGGTITVYVGNKRAEDLGNNEYRAIVRKSGVCYIHATEQGAGITYTAITIEGITSTTVDSTPPRILEFICSHEHGTNLIKISAYDEESKIVGYAISNSSDEPTQWANYNKVTLKTSQEIAESGTYYLHVKNGIGLTSSQSLIVDLNYNYVITYDLDGGTGDINNQVVVRGRSVNIPNIIPEKEGYLFQGWSATQGGAVIYRAGNSITPDGDMTLYAIYVEASMFDVVLDPNGGSLGNIPGVIYGKEREGVALPSSEPTRMYYKFLGWASSNDADEPEYLPGGRFTAGDTTVLYAVWQLDIFVVDDNGIITGIKEDAIRLIQTKEINYYYENDGYAESYEYEDGTDAGHNNDIVTTTTEDTIKRERPLRATVENYSDDVGCWQVTTTNECVVSEIKIPKVIDGKIIRGIGPNAFAEIDGINSIIIPDTVTSIGEYAFSYCSDLTSVKLPAGLTNISDNTFFECEKLLQVNIPAGVTSIGAGAFCGCLDLEVLEIPNSVTSIGNSCFSSCYSLQAITIPSGVTRIENYTFFRCSSLRKIVLPNGLTYIGDNTFYDCNLLSSISIPESVTSIGKNAFRDCDNLESINIPRNLTSIPQAMCEACIKLSSIDIPNGITTIEQYAFSYCSNLNSLVIPNSVTQIDSYAFSGCSSIKNITIPNNLTNLGAGAFSGCSALTNLVIPSGISTIKESTFRYCSGLTELNIPNNITKIEQYAFGECTGLTELNIPNTVTTIGDRAFWKCTGLTRVEVPQAGVPNVYSGGFSGIFGWDSNIETIILKEGVTEIGMNAFKNRTNLKTVSLPSTLKTIHHYAFQNCTGLDNNSFTFPEGLETIETYAFDGCTGITELSFPSTLSSIGSYSFCGTHIAEIVMPRTLRVYSYAFKDCIYLRDVEISNCLCNGDTGTAGGNGGLFSYVFEGCTDLHVKIADGVVWIGENVFQGCTNIVSMEIPESVHNIRPGAFAGCSSLTSINIPSHLGTIPQNGFYGCASLTTVVLPSAVQTIEPSAFYGCTGLERLDIPSTVRTIGSNAFYNVSHVYYSGTASGSPWGARAIN